MAIEVGTKVSGKVSGITNFGAFVDLEDHKTGLVHISQVSNSFVKDIHDVLSVGDEVTVKVISIADDGKIALSIKAASEPEHSSKTGSQSGAKHYEHNNNHRSSSDNQHSSQRGYSHSGSQSNSFKGNRDHQSGSNGGKEDFDSLLSGFLKESESRLSTLRHNTEGKRGGRGGRRS
ncbi:S1 domain-containing RNA-binding protein [Paucilactobacillus kaifaensis]|uniref:S1 domain-containing RNA-binding protein n=1 Tax=Paucilactobacillus kaifaensis TaxID=2559921 RepID=UPI0010F547A3|nr:S1 domain-containing RNA-binding protein [Paucilactobacillus kaifaensis]